MMTFAVDWALKANYLPIYCHFLNLIHFIIPFGKFGPPYPGRNTSAARVALRSYTSACWGVFFRVSVIHQTLTGTTGSLTCVRDNSYECVYTRGLATPTASQHNIFDTEKLWQICLVLLHDMTQAGFEPPVCWSEVGRCAILFLFAFHCHTLCKGVPLSHTHSP